MNNSKKFILVGGVIVLMLAFVWFFAGSPGGEKGVKPYTSSNWGKRFQPFDKDPLGLYLFNTLLHAHITKKHDMYEARDWMELDSIMIANPEPKTYMFVGNFFGMKNSEMDKIVEDIEENGSDLFISYNTATDNIMPYFFTQYEERYEYNTIVNVFTDKYKCEMINLYQNDTIACDWNAFGEIVTKGKSKSLSSFMEMDNFIVIEMGKGRIFLQTDPAMYYNYQIKRSSGYKYTEYTLNQLSKDKDVLLLELARLSDGYGNHDTDDDGKGGKEDNSYLKILFENPTLLSALLLSILGMILFVSFRSKRKRPIVPYQEQKQDMTMAFAETITSIYFAKRNPYGLLQVQRKNFYDTIHKHFFVDLSKRGDEDRELVILAEKSNKPLEDIQKIVRDLETKEASQVTESQVAEMAKQQRAFYRDVGIISESVQERVEERELKFQRNLLLPVLMVLGGLSAIIVGLYFLVTARGVGIALWPVGIALLFLGIARLANPYMRVNTKSIIYYTSLGRKKTFLRSDLIGTEMKESGVVLRFTNNRTLIINYWDLSRFDRIQFDRFMSKLHTLEL